MSTIFPGGINKACPVKTLDLSDLFDRKPVRIKGVVTAPYVYKNELGEYQLERRIISSEDKNGSDGAWMF